MRGSIAYGGVHPVYGMGSRASTICVSVVEERGKRPEEEGKAETVIMNR